MVRLLMLSSLLSLPAFAENSYLVAARDLPAGTKLAAEMLSQRTSNAKLPGTVTVDKINMVLKQALMVPLRKGDLLMWFEISTDTSVNERCNKATSPR
jgi:flagella basal body P-ring formation protein FlgA